MRAKFFKLAKRCRKILFGKYLLPTNMILTAGTMGCGDFLQQQGSILTGKIEKYDIRRTFNIAVTGSLYGVFGHYYFGFLDNIWPTSPFKKTAFDMLILSPLEIALFFLGVDFLEGLSYADSWKELKSKFVMVYIADAIIWIPAQTVNFLYVRPRYRVLYTNFILLIYGIYLSYAKSI